MPAYGLLNTRYSIDDHSFVAMSIYAVEPPIRGSEHNYKYRLVYVVNDVCLLRYDNERGKGDHKHVNGVEYPMTFIDIATLITDFQLDIESLRK